MTPRVNGHRFQIGQKMLTYRLLATSVDLSGSGYASWVLGVLWDSLKGSLGV